MRMYMFDLSGRVALVTGGSRGLGRRARRIRSQSLGIGADVSHWNQCDSVVERAFAPAGKVARAAPRESVERRIC
jgi:hypothetical protein